MVAGKSIVYHGPQILSRVDEKSKALYSLNAQVFLSPENRYQAGQTKEMYKIKFLILILAHAVILRINHPPPPPWCVIC